jgi:hypothetical protein
MSDNYIPWWVPADHPARTDGVRMPEGPSLEVRVERLEKLIPAMERRLPPVVAVAGAADAEPTEASWRKKQWTAPEEQPVSEPTVAAAERDQQQAELEQERRDAFTPGVPSPERA